MKRFSAGDVHRAFHWISGTTLHNRIRKGLCPVVSKAKGTGSAHKFTEAGLIHVAVVDELSALGAWRELTPLTEMDVEFIPAPEHEKAWNSQKPANVHRSALLFYELHSFGVMITVDILHKRYPEPGKTRQKRAPRIYYVRFHPLNDKRVKPYNEGGLVMFRDGIPLDGVSSATINVYWIWLNAQYRLELLPEPKLE